MFMNACVYHAFIISVYPIEMVIDIRFEKYSVYSDVIDYLNLFVYGTCVNLRIHIRNEH